MRYVYKDDAASNVEVNRPEWLAPFLTPDETNLVQVIPCWTGLIPSGEKNAASARFLRQSPLRSTAFERGRPRHWERCLSVWLQRCWLLRTGATEAACNPTPSGRLYVGHKSVTVNGRNCQAWTSQFPHSHVYNQDSRYADGSKAAAVNYCRQPDANDQQGLWCYTTDLFVRWEKCSVRDCGQSLTVLCSVNRCRNKMLFRASR